MTKAAQQELENKKKEAIEYLKTILNPGDLVYTVLLKVSSSGTSRNIKLLVPVINMKEGQKIIDISWYVSKILNLKMNDDNNGVKISGAGMDMGFHLVYELGAQLWPHGDGKYTKNRNGNKGPETDGGYCLNQKWI